MNAALDPSLSDPASFARTRVSADRTGTWPPEPTEVTHILDGALATRVRRRCAESDDAEVKLTELTVYGGYSVYTQENSTTFTVSCGWRSQEFHPRGTADWVQDIAESYDSVYARFDAWLQAAERPAELFVEWFAFEAEAGRFVQYRSTPDTVLTRAAGDRRYGVDHLTLTGTSDGHGRTWVLDLVAAPDANGFSAVLQRVTLCYVEGLALAPEVARAILLEITDNLMPGESAY